MDAQLQSTLKTLSLSQPLGLYIHVPFCRTRCSYCSFASSTDILQEPHYVKRLLQDMKNWGSALNRPKLDTLYMGGGTPSMLSLHSLQAVSQVIHLAFNTAELLEATLEANPDSINRDWLEAAKIAGWNRISIGVQTLDDNLLRCLGRSHSASQSLDSIQMCLETGYKRVSADLLVGVPGQNLGRVLEDAESLVDIGVEHLSIYLLDMDKPCHLKSQLDSGQLELPSEAQVAETYSLLREHLSNCGLEPYEISNFSRLGCQSIHNVRYWQRRPYIGLGPSAASNLGNVRWTEDETISKWVDGNGQQDVQILSTEESFAEIPLLALRMHEGINWRALREQAETLGLGRLIQKWEHELAPFIKNGLLKWKGENIRLTPRGMLLSNQVFQIFV